MSERTSSPPPSTKSLPGSVLSLAYGFCRVSSQEFTGGSGSPTRLETTYA